MAAAPSHASVPPDTLYGTAEHVVLTIDQEDGSISTLTRQRPRDAGARDPGWSDLHQSDGGVFRPTRLDGDSAREP